MRRVMSLLTGAMMSMSAASAQAQSVDGVRVHLDAADDIVLQQKAGREWIDVCVAPCDRRLDGDRRYRIDGPGVRPSSPFSLRATSLEGSETLVVAPSYVGARAAGFVLVGVGAAGLFVGGILAWVAANSQRCETTASIPSTTHCEVALPNLIVIGLVSAAGSAVVGAMGAFLAIDSSHSTVTHTASRSMKPHIHFLASDVPSHWNGATETRAVRGNSSALLLFPLVEVSF